MSLGAILQGVSGLAGLFGGGRSGADRSRDEMLARQSELYRLLADAAQGYDPAREDQAAIDEAARSASINAGNALKGLNAEFRNSGGNAGMDSLFNVKAQGITDRAYDPLRSLAAQLASTRTERRLGALAQAAGGGGSLVGQYMQAGQQDRANDTTGSSIGLLSGALGSIFGRNRSNGQVVNNSGPGALSGRGLGAEMDITNRWGGRQNWLRAPEPIKLKGGY